MANDPRRFWKPVALLVLIIAITIPGYFIVSGVTDSFNSFLSKSTDGSTKTLHFEWWQVLGVLLLFGLIAALLSDHEGRKIDKTTLTELQTKEDKIADDLNDNKTDFGSLWAVTQQRITYYHRIATRQSTRSFISTQAATIVGFMLVVFFGVLASQATTPTGAVSAGAVGVVGAGLAAYISRTFMKAQSEASAQLQLFFAQPAEFSRFLGAERLLESLPVDERPEAVRMIVQSMMLATSPVTTTKPKRRVKKNRSNAPEVDGELQLNESDSGLDH